MAEGSVAVATWNLEWSAPRAASRCPIDEQVAAVAADVWVFTEMVAGTEPPGGHVCDAGDDWGYRIADRRRRKVAIWSRNPWRDVELLVAGAANGRLIAATTDTDLGPLRVVGVCIPWWDAHVRTGRRDRRAWEDHMEYLSALRSFLARQPRPLVVAGDFNQRLPRASQPTDVHQALLDAFDGLRVATADLQGDLLDHIAHSADIAATAPMCWPGTLPDGRVLTDHWGASVTLRR